MSFQNGPEYEATCLTISLHKKQNNFLNNPIIFIVKIMNTNSEK